METFFAKGMKIAFHATINGKRRTKILGRAEEDGYTGRAQRYKVRIKPGVVKVPGKNIYMVFSE